MDRFLCGRVPVPYEAYVLSFESNLEFRKMLETSRWMSFKRWRLSTPTSASCTPSSLCRTSYVSFCFTIDNKCRDQYIPWQVLTPVCGILVDVFGISLVSLACAGIVTAGQLMFTVGTFYNVSSCHCTPTRVSDRILQRVQACADSLAVVQRALVLAARLIFHDMLMYICMEPNSRACECDAPPANTSPTSDLFEL